jgi:hypothetical protein
MNNRTLGLLGLSGIAAAVAFFVMRPSAPSPDPLTLADTGTTMKQQEPAGGEVLVAGTVEAVGPAADMARQMGTAYVILRDAGGGPPYAVKRVHLNDRQPSFVFSLTTQDIMIPGSPRPSNPVLKIRFDGDGDPMTEVPGDLVATTKDFAWGDANLSLEATMFSGQPQN